MTTYHLSPKTNKYAPCRATTKRCPFSEWDHFEGDYTPTQLAELNTKHELLTDPTISDDVKLEAYDADLPLQTKRALAEDENTPDELLEDLLYSDEWDVKEAAIFNPNTPEEAAMRAVSEIIFEDRLVDRELKLRLADGYPADHDAIAFLTLDSDEEIAKRAASSLDEGALEYLANHEDENVLYAVAIHEKATPEALAILAKNYWTPWRARQVIADHENATPSTLTLLAEDNDKDVRRGVAENKNTPPALLTKLSEDEDWDVKFSVEYNENTPEPIREKLWEDRRHKEVSEGLL